MSQLAELQERLEKHFAALSDRRREVRGVDSRVFALEHGLDEEELEAMTLALRSSFSASREAWLPLVVVAAEEAFEYVGTSYWPAFTKAVGDDSPTTRNRVRNYFQRFADEFGGPEPTGRFAEHFRIIAWPLANAIIPSDLQAHLVSTLTSLPDYAIGLVDPKQLGEEIANEVEANPYAPDRFKEFVKDHGLIGYVALAFLSGPEQADGGNLILKEVKERIIAGLGEQKRAELTSVIDRRRKVHPGGSGGNGPGGGSRRQTSFDPRFQARLSSEEWEIYVELPDLRPLMERHSGLGDEVLSKRLLISGCNRPVEAGQVLKHRHWMRLDACPREPVVRLDGGSKAISRLLGAYCQLTEFPWLFELREPSLGRELKGKAVHPGREYLLVSDAPIGDVPTWFQKDSCLPRELHAYKINVPEDLDSDCSKFLKGLGLGVRIDFEIAPVGLPPAKWTGDDVAEWIQGESPVLRLSSLGSPVRYTVNLVGDLVPLESPWPPGEQDVYFQFEGLRAGPHEVQISLRDEQTTLDSDSSFTIVVRPEYNGPETRQALRIYPSSENPSLGDLWQNLAQLEFTGPDKAEVDVQVQFDIEGGGALPPVDFNVRLPFGYSDWWMQFQALVISRNDLTAAFLDESMERCSIQINNHEFGNDSIDCERFFSPVQWLSGLDDQGHWAQLRMARDADPDEVTEVMVDRYTALTADWPSIPSLLWSGEPGQKERANDGALFWAQSEDAEAGIIVPPEADTSIDTTFYKAGYPGRDGQLVQLVEVVQLWAAAEPSIQGGPSERFRGRVIRALLSHMATLVCGDEWASVESMATDDSGSMEGFCQSLSNYGGPISVCLEDLVARSQELAEMSFAERCSYFGTLLNEHGQALVVENRNGATNHQLLVETLFELAAEPARLDLFPLEVRRVLSKVEAHPNLLRLARAMVLLVHLQSPDGDGTYRGFQWP